MATKKATPKKNAPRKTKATGNDAGSGALDKALAFPPKTRGKAKSPERLKVEEYLAKHPNATAKQIEADTGIDAKKAQTTKNNITQAKGSKGKRSRKKVAKVAVVKRAKVSGVEKADTNHHHALDAAAALVKAVGGSLHNAIDYLHKLVPFSGR